jgi:hypothetical protein
LIASLSAPLALGGESLAGNGTAIAVVSAISIVGGYLLLAGLWYFIFREKRTDDLSADHQPTTQEPPENHDSSTRIQRPAGSRFRRR